MSRFQILRSLMMKHKYQLIFTYSLFSVEMLGGLLRFYFFGEAINGLIKGSYAGLIVLAVVHLSYLIVGTIRHMYDTRTYTAIYTSLVTKFLSRRYSKVEVSKLSAHSTLAREFVDFLEHDLVYVIEAVYNILGSLVLLFFYDKTVVGICLAILIPVIIISLLYGKKMKQLNKDKNDELEKQVDIISTGNNTNIRHHYNKTTKAFVTVGSKEEHIVRGDEREHFIAFGIDPFRIRSGAPTAYTGLLTIPDIGTAFSTRSIAGEVQSVAIGC